MAPWDLADGVGFLDAGSRPASPVAEVGEGVKPLALLDSGRGLGTTRTPRPSSVRPHAGAPSFRVPATGDSHPTAARMGVKPSKIFVQSWSCAYGMAVLTFSRMGFTARFGGRRRNLVDRVVLITGAGHGIGAASARLLVNEGARVALLDCDEAAVRRVAAALDGRAGAFVADVTNPTSLNEAVTEVIAHFGAIDVVVVNAGVMGPVDKFEDADADTYDRMLEVNLFGVIRTVRATLPHIIASRGYLLLVSSAAALSPCPAISGYGASKAGVEAFGRALRIELAPTGANAGVTYFGMMDTGLVRDGLLNNTGWEAIMAALPGLFGRPEPAEVAAEAIVSGIRTRARWVCAPRWVYALLMFRSPLAIADPLLARTRKVQAAGSVRATIRAPE